MSRLVRWGSAELQVLLRPGATFARLVADPQEGLARLLGRVGLLLVVLSSAVSLTTAGRLVPSHLALGLLAWSFVPAIQLGGALASIVVFHARDRASGHGGGHRRGDRVRLLSVYAAGNGPWLLLFTLLPAVFLASPEMALRFWIARGALPIAVALTLGHGAYLTFAFHRAALGLPRARAIGALAVDLGVKTALTLGWFQAMNNLLPQLLGPSG